MGAQQPVPRAVNRPFVLLPFLPRKRVVQPARARRDANRCRVKQLAERPCVPKLPLPIITGVLLDQVMEDCCVCARVRECVCGGDRYWLIDNALFQLGDKRSNGMASSNMWALLVV